MNVVAIDPATDPRWGALLAARGGSLFHSPPWFNSLADAYGFRVDALLSVDRDGRPVAGLPYCRITDFGVERIVSVPFSDYCDPLVTSPAQWEKLLREISALDLATYFRFLAEQFANGDTRFEVVKRARWHGLSMESDLDAQWRCLAPPTRRAIKKAEREGVRVRLNDDDFLAEFLRHHVALRKRKYRLLAQPAAFFEAIRSRFADIDGWFPMAAWHDGRIVAATIFLRWDDTLYYKFNASASDALAVRPNDALLWAGVRLAHQLGCRRLDLGASDDDQPGLVRFKRHYGAQEREIRFLRSAPQSKGDDRHAQIRAMLGKLTNFVTDPSVPDAVAERAGAELYRFFV